MVMWEGRDDVLPNRLIGLGIKRFDDERCYLRVERDSEQDRSLTILARKEIPHSFHQSQLRIFSFTCSFPFLFCSRWFDCFSPSI